MPSPVRSLVLAAAVALSATVAVPVMAIVGTATPAGAAGSAGGACSPAVLAHTAKPVQLSFWESMPEQNGVMLNQLTNAFNASQHQVHVTLVNQANYQDTWTKVQSALTTGNLPSMVQLEDINLQGAVDSGAFMPIQSCIKGTHYSTSDFLPRILSYWKVKGVQQGMPFNVSAPLVFYNKQAFTKAGLGADTPPSTLAEYLTDAKTLKSSGTGTGFELDPWFVEAWLGTANQLFVNHKNGRSGRASKAVFNTKVGKSIFTQLSSLVRSGDAVTNPFSGPDEYDNLLGIGSGKYGMTIGYSSALGTVEKLLQQGKYPNVTLGVGAFPRLAAADNGGVQAGGAALYISKKDSAAVKAAAWQYIQYLDSPASQVTWAAGTGYIPIRKSATASSTIQNLWSTNPGYKLAYDELTQGTMNAASAGPAIGPFSQVQVDMVTAMESMFIKGASPSKALSAANSSVSQTLSSYNGRL